MKLNDINSIATQLSDNIYIGLTHYNIDIDDVESFGNKFKTFLLLILNLIIIRGIFF